MEIQRGNLKNAGLTQKHGRGSVTFKYQKALRNISLAIKESLRITNGSQYTNYKMNN